MKFFVSMIFLGLILSDSCDSKKSGAALFDTTWELEYISGPRIAFEGLYPENRPQISFDQETGKVSGTDSCNGYSADYEISGSSISFGEPGPTTMMFCGGGEQQFLNMMQKIDSYSIEDDKLNLLVGEVPILRFKKLTP